MQRRTLVLAALAAVTAIIPRPLAAAPTPRAGHRRRRHYRTGSAAAGASASVTGPNGGTSVAVTCNDEHEAETDPTAAQVACQD